MRPKSRKDTLGGAWLVKNGWGINTLRLRRRHRVAFGAITLWNFWQLGDSGVFLKMKIVIVSSFLRSFPECWLTNRIRLIWANFSIRQRFFFNFLVIGLLKYLWYTLRVNGLIINNSSVSNQKQCEATPKTKLRQQSLDGESFRPRLFPVDRSNGGRSPSATRPRSRPRDLGDLRVHLGVETRAARAHRGGRIQWWRLIEFIVKSDCEILRFTGTIGPMVDVQVGDLLTPGSGKIKSR